MQYAFAVAACTHYDHGLMKQALKEKTPGIGKTDP